MKKKVISIIACAALAVSLAACGSSGGSGDSSGSADSSGGGETTTEGSSGITLQLAYNLTTDDVSIFEDLCAQFTDETGIGISILNLGDDYESAMKTRMSSGDLPDIWVTHGWSLIRYSEYLTDLSDQDWVQYIDEGLKSVITNDEDELFILPITQSVCGIMYNKDVLEEAGIEPTDIRTWDDFADACEAIKNNTDATPIEMCLNDGFDSYFLEDPWPTFYSNPDAPDYAVDELLDGTFDWTTDGREAFEMAASWYNNGYINDDYASGKKDDVCQAIAYGEGCFCLYSSDVFPAVLYWDEDANIGIIPVPAASEGGDSYFGTGEGNYSCFGIWKDTEYPDECKQFLDYLAEPENAVQIVQIDGGIPGLTDIELDSDLDAAYTTNALNEAKEEFGDSIYYDNYFDREYLPSGMWSVMQDAIATLLADGDPDADMDAAVGVVEDNYADLMNN